MPKPLQTTKRARRRGLTVLDLCTGAGGEALGVEQAGFRCVGAVEIDTAACKTLRQNRKQWKVLEKDIREVHGAAFGHVDLVAAGVPCPPFSKAGRQLGHEDERDLFPEALRIVEEAGPSAVLLENVRGLADPDFESYREWLFGALSDLGFQAKGELLQASDYGVPQLRPRFVIVALRPKYMRRFEWPGGSQAPPKTVGETLKALMASGGWPGAEEWAERAADIAPTLVGGSKKHGGPDLGPTRSKRRWEQLGVDGMGLADEPPGPEFPVGENPKLTVPMTALLQGFPPEWKFWGKKTASYRQVGNAFPPPVSRAVAEAIAAALRNPPEDDDGVHPFVRWQAEHEAGQMAMLAESGGNGSGPHDDGVQDAAGELAAAPEIG